MRVSRKRSESSTPPLVPVPVPAGDLEGSGAEAVLVSEGLQLEGSATKAGAEEGRRLALADGEAASAPPVVPAVASLVVDEEEGDEEEAEELDGGEDDTADDGLGGDEERPKLDEGFYEIEDIRKRRVLKGQLQYLIKWRGWPETANTWEPYDNIQSCADMIEVFEERLRSRKHSRKRKRKSGGLQSVTNKKRPSNSKASNPAGSSRTASLPDSSDPLTSSSSKADTKQKDDHFANTVEGGVETRSHCEEKSRNVNPVGITTNPKENSDIPTESKAPGCGADGASANISVHLRTLEGDGSTDGVPDSKLSQSLQANGRFTGAKRRKSGCVKRFDPTEAYNATVVNGEGSCGGAEKIGVDDVELTGDEAAKSKVDGTNNPPSLTKILMPIEYSTSMIGNVQDVFVTFKALSSDGKEVLVTNKSLKTTNPQLLISFYEQHLRYAP